MHGCVYLDKHEEEATLRPPAGTPEYVHATPMADWCPPTPETSVAT